MWKRKQRSSLYLRRNHHKAWIDMHWDFDWLINSLLYFLPLITSSQEKCEKFLQIVEASGKSVESWWVRLGTKDSKWRLTHSSWRRTWRSVWMRSGYLLPNILSTKIMIKSKILSFQSVQIIDQICNWRKELIAQFRTLIEADDFLKNQEGENLRRDSYLTRFLRAGNWNPTNSLEVLRAYSSLGGEYTKYVSRAIPTR